MRYTWIVQDSAEGGDEIGSSRYRARIPAEGLRSEGADARVLTVEQALSDPASLGGPGVVVLQKLMPAEPYIARYQDLLQRVDPACRLVFDLNDDHFHQPPFARFYEAARPRARGWVASTEQMARRLRTALGVRPELVPDPYEGEIAAPRAPLGWLAGTMMAALDRVLKDGVQTAHIRLLWFGYPSNLGGLQDALEDLAAAAQVAALHIDCVTRREPAVEEWAAAMNTLLAPRVQLQLHGWSPETMKQRLAACDLVIIPARLEEPGKLAKSANRLLEGLVAGKFVVAHPVPSYLEFQQHAWIGERLSEGIAWAAQHPREAVRRIRSGQRLAMEKYSPRAVARRWGEVLRRFAQD